MAFLWPARSTGQCLPSKADVAIALLSCPSQMWFTPGPGDTESPVLHPGVWLCQRRSRAGTGQGHSSWLTSGSLQAEGCFCRKLEGGQSWELLENEHNGSCFLFGSGRALISAHVSHQSGQKEFFPSSSKSKPNPGYVEPQSALQPSDLLVDREQQHQGNNESKAAGG